MPLSYQSEAIAHAIDRMRHVNFELERLVRGLSETELTTAYLPGEWTVAQNVHHLADSQLLLYMRFKLILTEDNPPLKGNDQDAWATTPEAMDANITPSLAIIRGVHFRWANLMEALTEEQWGRIGQHSEYGAMTLQQIGVYAAEHGYLHVAQITQTLAAKPQEAD